MPEESKVTLKVGILASLIAAIIVAAYGAIFNLHGRVTAVEVDNKYTFSTLCEIKDMVNEIRTDQIRREHKDIKGVKK